MPNTNVQAISVSDNQLRPFADKLAQLYNLAKALQADALANNWAGLFPADGVALGDNSAVDGRNPITDTDLNSLIAIAGTFITFMEATSFANRNVVNKIAVNPVRF